MPAYNTSVKALDILSGRKIMVSILQKGGYENDTAGSECKLIVKLLPPQSKESSNRHLTIRQSEAGLAGSTS